MRIGQNKNFINPNRDNYLDELIHDNTIRHGGINFVDSLTNPYLLQIHKRIRTGFLSLVEINGEKKVRLEEIWKLHKEGKSTREITDWMNGKYGTTLFTNKPYYPSLIWVTIDKRKKRESRLNDIRVSYEKVEFLRIEKLIEMNEVPRNLIVREEDYPKTFVLSNFLHYSCNRIDINDTHII